MCGICGSTSDPTGAAVAAMKAAMVHRGPDDEGTHVDGGTGLALGVRRLSIIDVEGGHQPLANEDGTIWAVLNGEIYNHPRLRARLAERGHRLATGTDTEVLVHLFEDFGDAFVHALEGMFAFALWDGRRRRLILGRDRFGEKPLFYTRRDGNLAFASELTALRAGVPQLGELNPDSMDAFFVYGYVPGPATMFKGVRQLEPGQLLSWEASSGDVQTMHYWRPPVPGAHSSSPTRELVMQTAELLDASVRSRMISDVPVGVFLSGGVDSTLIAALAARHSREPLKTFTVGYEVGTVSETGPARAAARRLGAEHHELVLTQEDVGRRVPGLLAALDQPLADQALVALHAVAELARREVTVIVGGEGADELFAGYPRYRWLARASALDGLVPARLATRAAQALRDRGRSTSAARLADVLQPQPPLERHIDWVTDRRRHLRPVLYGPALRSRMRDQRPPIGGEESLDGRDIAGWFMHLDQCSWLPDDVLVKADRAGMLVSLELRTPYLHRELAEFAASVPVAAHTANEGKALLRAVMRQVVPGATRRPKAAFRVPAADWLRGPLRPTLDAQLANGSLYEEGWFDRGQMSRIVEELVSGRREWSHVVWPVMALGLWLDHLRGADAR
jgi:asparagine synthase (glutamine-hydrolysing)